MCTPLTLQKKAGLFAALMLVCLAPSPAQAAKPHPLFGNKIIGNSAEIVALWPGVPNSDSCRAQILDFVGSANNIVPKPAHTWTGTHNWEDMKMHALTSGDYNGDGCDDIAAVYYTGGFGNNMKLVLPHVTGASLDWSNAEELYLGTVNGWYPGYRYTNLAMASGNFDSDDKDEFVLAFWGLFDGLIHVQVYETNPSLAPTRVAEVATEYMPYMLSDPPICLTHRGSPLPLATSMEMAWMKSSW